MPAQAASASRTCEATRGMASAGEGAGSCSDTGPGPGTTGATLADRRAAASCWRRRMKRTRSSAPPKPPIKPSTAASAMVAPTAAPQSPETPPLSPCAPIPCRSGAAVALGPGRSGDGDTGGAGGPGGCRGGMAGDGGGGGGYGDGGGGNIGGGGDGAVLADIEREGGVTASTATPSACVSALTDIWRRRTSATIATSGLLGVTVAVTTREAATTARRMSLASTPGMLAASRALNAS